MRVATPFGPRLTVLAERPKRPRSLRGLLL
jgi:hypothetical protein